MGFTGICIQLNRHGEDFTTEDAESTETEGGGSASELRQDAAAGRGEPRPYKGLIDPGERTDLRRRLILSNIVRSEGARRSVS
jgi:hypothetical protein